MDAPRERPILFSAPMVRAILDGRKSQTRRVVKAVAPPEAVDAGVIASADPASNGLWWWLDATDIEWASPVGETFRCPYGVPGDLLWVREEFSGPHELSTVRPGLWEVVAVPPPPIWYWADGEPAFGDWTKPKPSIHMPRCASRITLRITDVRVERLNEISEADAVAEGVFPAAVYGGEVKSWLPAEDRRERFYDTAVEAYAALWEAINGPGSWDANPWVWAVSFERVGQ